MSSISPETLVTESQNLSFVRLHSKTFVRLLHLFIGAGVHYERLWGCQVSTRNTIYAAQQHRCVCSWQRDDRCCC